MWGILYAVLSLPLVLDRSVGIVSNPQTSIALSILRKHSKLGINSASEEMQAIEYLWERAGRFQLLTREEEYVLLRAVHSGTPEESAKAMSELVDRNLRLVIKNARRYMGRGFPLEDLVQDGVAGLVHAIQKWDFSKNCKLSTYATWWIRQRIGRALNYRGRLVRLSEKLAGEITQLDKAYIKFIEDNCRAPNSVELAEVMKLTKEKVEELGRYKYVHVSLDETSGDEEDSLPMVSFIADDTSDSEAGAETAGDRDYIEKLLFSLPEEDANFLRLRFGFLDFKERTPREMASYLGTPLKEARLREKNILDRLRESANIEESNYELE
jgi:RNA polymerase primary sigma factor